MNAAQAIVTKLIAGGMDPVEAASLLAHAVVEMSVPAGGKSSAALRQQRYRERNKSVTKRNESVTEQNEPERNETVTNRNETVTPLRPGNSPISYLLTSSSNSLEKKESKKERQPRKRNAPLPDDWAPSLRAFQLAEQCGQNVQIVEGIFRDYLKSSGKLYADYDAAFNNFIRNQQRFSGKNGTSQNRSGGSLVASINRELAELEQSEGTHFELPEGRIRLISS